MSISSRITYVPSNDLLADETPQQRAPAPPPARRRHLAGLALAVVALPLLTLLLADTRGSLSLEGQVLLSLLVVLVVALVGGLTVALLTAVAAALLINYEFVEPRHTLDIREADQAVALIVFVIVAAVVSIAVETAARRARAAELARAEAETLSALAGPPLDQDSTIGEILERARETFGMQTVLLKARDRGTGDWETVEQAGWGVPGAEAELQFDIAVDPRLRLIGRGPAMFAEDQRVLHAFGSAVRTAYEGRRLSEAAREGRNLATVDRQRTALLAAVGHDLRTPLATIKASVSTLRQTDVAWSEADRRELLEAIETSADRLDGVVGNLLDASRLQAGLVGVRLEPVALDEVVAAAILATADAEGHVAVAVPEDLPPVCADRGLLERVLVNLIDNGLRHGNGQLEVRAVAVAESARLEVVDHGPGVAPEHRERLFAAFQRLDDRSNETGVGLGLWVSRGFLEAMGGALVADDSPGGGLTMRVRLPLAVPGRAARGAPA